MPELPDEPEIVLRERPLELHVEVFTAKPSMPKVDGKRIYILTMKPRQWSVDGMGKVMIKRFGFPLVPDFGGTAHAYCGSTLEACLGDFSLLSHNFRN